MSQQENCRVAVSLSVTTETASLPVRTARHHPWCIATLRMTIAQVLLRRLDGCPYCATPSL